MDEEVVPAIWLRRAGALALDTVLILAVGSIVLAVAGDRPYWHELHAQRLSGGERATRDSVAIVLAWLYSATALWRFDGRTLGKHLLGIRVTRRDGTPVSYPRAILREVVLKTGIFDVLALALHLGGVALLLSAIDYLAPLWPSNGENLAIHDLLAGTRVVLQRRP